MPWLLMRDGLRFMLEGSGEFEVAGHARDGAEAVVVWAVRNGLLDEWRHGLLPATCGGCALRRSSSGASWATDRVRHGVRGVDEDLA